MFRHGFPSNWLAGKRYGNGSEGRFGDQLPTDRVVGDLVPLLSSIRQFYLAVVESRTGPTCRVLGCLKKTCWPQLGSGVVAGLGEQTHWEGSRPRDEDPWPEPVPSWIAPGGRVLSLIWPSPGRGVMEVGGVPASLLLRHRQRVVAGPGACAWTRT